MIITIKVIEISNYNSYKVLIIVKPLFIKLIIIIK